MEDSDGTLIVNCGELDGGSLATKALARHLGKPCLVVQVDTGVSVDAATRVLVWLRQHHIETLNVAGPRESERPGLCGLAKDLLAAVDAAARKAGERR